MNFDTNTRKSSVEKIERYTIESLIPEDTQTKQIIDRYMGIEVN